MSHQNRTFVQQTQISGTLGEITSIPASLATYQTDHRTLADDLKAIRFQVDSIIGETTWLDAPNQDLATIYGGLHVSGSNVEVQGNLTALGNVSGLSGSFSDGLYVGGDGISVVAGGMTIAGDSLEVNGTLDVTGTSDLADVYTSGNVNVSGSLTVSGSADYNGGVTANSIKIDGDVAQRLYIVDADGSIKDEAKLTFDGSKLLVSGALQVATGASLDSTLTVAAGSTFNGLADFNADVTANKVSIDGDVAQRLYIVDADGSIKDEAKLTFDGSKLLVSGALQVASGASLDSTLTVAAGSTFNGLADFNADVTANKVSIDGDVAQRLYIVDADGSMKDEANLTFNGTKLAITGKLDVSSDAVVSGTLAALGAATLSNGLTVNGAAADFNADVTANKISIDGDTANRLYIVDADGSIKDEAKLTFDGSAFILSGTFESTSAATVGGSLTVQGMSTFNDDMDLNGDLDVSGVVDLSASGSMTTVRGNLTVDGPATFSSTMGVTELATFSNGLTVNGAAADFNANVTANKISIDSDVATRLYIVDADGSIKDEAKLTFDGTTLEVTGDGHFTGDVQVDGDLRVKGSMTYIDTQNMRVEDAFIYLATGSAGTTDSGIVLHGGAGAGMDLVIGQDGGAGEVIFGKGNRAPDGDGAMDGITLVPAWLSSVKLGNAEGSLSGSLAISGNDLALTASSDLVLTDQTDSLKLGSSADWAAFNASPVGTSTSIVGALAALASGGSSKKAVITGAVAADTNIAVAVDGLTFRSTNDMSKDMDVYLNGILLKGNETDSNCDYYRGTGAGNIKLNFAMDASDVLTVVFRNPESV